MTRRDPQRLVDIESAVQAIDAHLQRGSISDDLVFDAVRVRLIEIGEAVKAIDPELLAREPTIAWREIAGMRDHLAHHYFDTDHNLVQIVIDRDLPALLSAVERLQSHSS